MSHYSKPFISHILFFCLLLLIPAGTLFYFGYYSRIPFAALLIMQLLIIFCCLRYFHKTLLEPCRSMGDTTVPPDYTEQQEKLMKQLEHNNLLLERNIRITGSIFQITSDILTSGEIDEILQHILDKAIEVIPNAQKGSILFYNGEKLEFRAVKGYDFEVLKKIQFGLDEIFLSQLEDFRQPCIIDDVEDFNRKHVRKNNFRLLSEGRGFELRSVISCAIFVDDDFYGTINLDNADRACAFQEEDKAYIKHLANQIGIALKNAKLIEKAIYLSRHDSLTRIYNRRYFEELLLGVIEQSGTKEQVFSLVIFDINDLKYTNDTYGHEAGDLLIKSFVDGVGRFISGGDIFARYGGDEFAAILSGRTASEAFDLLQRIEDYFGSRPFIYCAREILSIHFGYGVAEFPAESRDMDTLLRLADRRMYENKKMGKKS